MVWTIHATRTLIICKQNYHFMRYAESLGKIPFSSDFDHFYQKIDFYIHGIYLTQIVYQCTGMDVKKVNHNTFSVITDFKL